MKPLTLGLALAAFLLAVLGLWIFDAEAPADRPAPDTRTKQDPVDSLSKVHGVENPPPRSEMQTEEEAGTRDQHGVEEVSVQGTLMVQPGGWPSSVEGVDLHLSSEDGRRPSKRAPVTNERWRASLSPGSWTVKASREGQVLRVEPGQFLVEPSVKDAIHLSVVPMPVVRGRIVDCEGNPIAGVAVRIEGRSAANVTLPDGTFTLRPSRGGRHTVAVDESTLPGGIAPPWWQRLEQMERVGLDHQVSTAIGGEFAEIVLSPIHHVRGVAVGADSRPLGSVTLSIRMKADPGTPARGANHVLLTDERGMFDVQLAAGTYEARVFPRPGGSSKAWPDPVSFEIGCYAPTGSLTLTFDKGLGNRTLTGVVLDGAGEPAEGLLFRVNAVGDGLTFENRLLYQPKGSQQSGPNGSLSISGLSEGQYLVSRVTSVSPRSDLIYVDDQSHIVVDLRGGDGHFEWRVSAHRPSRVEGTLSVDQIPARWVRIALVVDRWSEEITHELTRGSRFVFEGVPPGLGEITVLEVVEDRRHPIASRTVQIPEDRTVTVQLP